MARSLLGWRLSAKALGGKLGAEWERDRRDTLFLLGSIVLSVITHVGHLPIWVTTSFAILFFWRLGLVLSGRWLPGTWVRVIGAIAATLGVYVQFGTIFGREAGVSLLVLFLGLKLMEIRAKRDLFVVIFLCLFLLLLAFLFSQSILNSIIVFTAMLTLLTTMLSMQFGHHEATMINRFKLSGMLLLKAVPIALVMFFLFPRLDQPLWKTPGDSRSARTGLSDSMSPGSISDLTESDDIAFKANFLGQAPAQTQLYWRGPVLSDYDGVEWKPSKYALVPPPAPQLSLPSNSSMIDYTVTMDAQTGNQLMALEFATELPVVRERNSTLTADFQILSADVSDDKFLYKVRSALGSKIGLNETLLTIQNHLNLPPGFNPRTLQLALDWRNAESDNFRLVSKALKLFSQEQFFYTMKPPLYGKNGVDEFLFEKKRGFCEHYAQAFVVLMRALDIPARVVTGYQGGETNPVDGTVTIRQKDAHAWAEVWLADQGWVRIDPTAAIAPDRVQKPVARLNNEQQTGASRTTNDFIRQVGFRLQAVSNAWNQWVLSYDRSKQKSLLKLIGLDPEQWTQLIGLLAAVMALALGLTALATVNPRGRRDRLEELYAKACFRLSAAGVTRAKNDTAVTLSARVKQNLSQHAFEQFQEIAKIYNRLRYENQKPDPKELEQLAKLVRGFKPTQKP